MRVSGNIFASGGNAASVAGCKGRIHVIGDQPSGFYAIDPMIEDAEGSKALILGVPLQFQEIVQPTTTLDDRRLLYLFGTSWNSISLAGLLLLGDSSTKGEQLTKLLQWYNQNRVSVKRGPISVSLGSTAVDSFVVALSLGQANSENNSQMFTVEMVTADVEA